MIKIIICIDGGKRYFKFKSQTITDKIPSLSTLAHDLSLHEKEDGLTVTIQGEDLSGTYYVGNTALQSFNSTFSISKNYCLESSHKVLLLTCIALVSPQISSIKVFSSLQINDFKLYRQKYINEYLNKLYSIKLPKSHHLITITDFDVFPQAGGDIFSLPENLLQNKKTALINIGYRDVNCCVVNWINSNPQYESSLSFSFNSGIYEADIAICKRLNQENNMDLSIEHLSNYLKRNPTILPEYKAQSLKISNRIKQIWQNLADFNQIYISGGGGLLLQHYILPQFPGSKLLPIDNPQFGNVEGMWKIAQDRFK